MRKICYMGTKINLPTRIIFKTVPSKNIVLGQYQSKTTGQRVEYENSYKYLGYGTAVCRWDKSENMLKYHDVTQHSLLHETTPCNLLYINTQLEFFIFTYTLDLGWHHWKIVYLPNSITIVLFFAKEPNRSEDLELIFYFFQFPTLGGRSSLLGPQTLHIKGIEQNADL
ncbi:hypothetical protein HUJ05_003171 [Dendroctonus ponderosae]|nr:hypothetical protein HUJ05_003171 [Dendroctonus ponderosae]